MALIEQVPMETAPTDEQEQCKENSKEHLKARKEEPARQVEGAAQRETGNKHGMGGATNFIEPSDLLRRSIKAKAAKGYD
jgi:hypothetical protein